MGSRHAAFPALEERIPIFAAALFCKTSIDVHLVKLMFAQFSLLEQGFSQTAMMFAQIYLPYFELIIDAQQIFAIGLVSDMLGFCYFTNNGNKIPQSDDTLIKVTTSVGTLLGQLFFGWLADVVGRKRMYGYELLIITLATLGQSITGPSSAISITGLLVFWRVIMGVGIGGDYPLSSVIPSEFSLTKWRGTMVAMVFSMQASGQLLASLVAFVVIESFKSQINNAQNMCNGDHCTKTPEGQLAVDRMWRIIVGFGAIPAIVALYCRLTIPETPRYTFDVTRDVEQGFADYKAFCMNTIGPMKSRGQVSADREDIRSRLNDQRLGGLDAKAIPQSSIQDFRRYFGNRRNFLTLVGTAGSWFFLDVAYYALLLNNTIFLQKMGFGSVSHETEHTIYNSLRNGAVGNLVLVAAGAIPGSITAIFFVDKIGRKPIQIGGFVMMTLFLLILGSAFNSINDSSRVALFVLTLFFVNFGPNTTTFIVPGECFPTRYRSTAHGISAASGKLGAVLAQALAGPLRRVGYKEGETDASPWLPHVIQILGAFAFLGLLTSLLIPETMGRSLEELAGEEYMEHEDKGRPSWHERLWSRLTNKRRPKESFHEEETSGSSIFPASSNVNGPAVFSDHESVRIGAPQKTELREKVAENDLQGDADGNPDRRLYHDNMNLTPGRL